MPYIYVDEVPEGTEAAEVVSQEHYDSLADELAATMGQRDEALQHLEESRRQTREAKAKYAKYVLDGGSKDKDEDQKPEAPKAEGMTVGKLFGKE